MLSLPSKPWKKVKIEKRKEGKYQITLLSPLKKQEEFKRIIEEDLKYCLGEEDRFSGPKWKTRSLTLFTQDIQAFRRRLLYQRIFIEDEETGEPRGTRSSRRAYEKIKGFLGSNWKRILNKK